MHNHLSLRWIVLAGGLASIVSLAACTTSTPTNGLAPAQATTKALAGDPIAPGPGGVFTTNCEAACNGAGVICGTVADPNTRETCCCIGGCPEWGPICAAGVNNGTIGPGQSPPGGGVYTANCEASCNGAGVTCGTVAGANNTTCCCIGTCPEWGPTCAAGVANGTIPPGAVPGPGGVFTPNCEASCNGAGVTCGTVAGANNTTCCCIGTCPEWGPTCAAGVANGTIPPGAVPAPGGGVFTPGCEAACNGAGVTCGTVANAAGQTCCCIGTCPELANFCANGVNTGVIRVGVRF